MDDSSTGKKRRKAKKESSTVIEVIPDGGKSHVDVHAFSEEMGADDLPLLLWIQLEGCDPVPVQVRSGLTVHELKLLFGGFDSAFHQPHPRSHGTELNVDVQQQQLALLGLRGVRPQLIKLRLSDDKPLNPSSKLNTVLKDGDTLQLQLAPSPVNAAALNSGATSNGYGVNGQTLTNEEIARLLYELRQELEIQRRRRYNYSPATTSYALERQPSASGLVIPTELARTDSAEPLMHTNGSSSSSLVNRLETLEAKLDAKNTQLDGIMKEMKTLSLALRGLSGAAPGGGPPEKGPNLVDGLINVKCKQTIEGHGGPVWVLAKTDAYLISGSSDTTVQAWDLQTMRPVRTMNGHTSIVHSVEVWNNMVISGSDDRCLKFWDMDQDFKCVKTIRANNVACVLRAASNHLFAGLYKTVKVWNLETGEFAGDLDNHNHWVRALNVTKGHLYSGCYNVINMIDLGTFKHMKSMTQNVGSIYSITVDNNMLYAGTYANAILVFDLRTFECVRTLTGHTGAVYSLALSKGLGKLYSGSYDNTIRVWDLNSLSPIQRYVGHTSSVEALLTTDAGLYSASTDGSIKLWR